VESFQLKTRPGGIIDTNSIDGVDFLRPTDLTKVGYEASTAIQMMIEKGTGATRPVMGLTPGPGGSRTATGTISQVQETQQRLRLVIQRAEEYLLRPFIKRCYQLNQQYLTKARIIRVVGEKGINVRMVRPEEVCIGDVDFICMGSMTMADETLKIQQMVNFLNIVGNIPGFNPRPILKKIWEAFGFRDFDELWTPEKPMMFPQTTGMAPPQEQPRPTSPEQMAEYMARMRAPKV